MECSASTSITGWSKHQGNSQADRNDRKPWFIRVLQKLWLARLCLPVWTVLNGFRLNTDYTMLRIRPFIFSRWYAPSIYNPLLRSATIAELASTSTFKTQHKVVAAEAGPGPTAPSLHRPDAGDANRTDRTDHTFSEIGARTGDQKVVQPSLLLPSHSNEKSTTDSDELSPGDMRTMEVEMPTPRDDPSSADLYRDDQVRFLTTLKAVRNSADQTCPIYYLFPAAPNDVCSGHERDITRHRAHQSYSSLQALGPASLGVQITNLLCPRSPFLKEQPTSGPDLTAGSLLPTTLLQTISSVKLGFPIPFLQGAIDVPVLGPTGPPGTVKEEERDERSESSDEISEHTDLPFSDISEISVTCSEGYLLRPSNDEIGPVSATQTNEHGPSSSCTLSTSSHTGTSSRGGSSFVNAPSSYTTLGGQRDEGQPPSKKRKGIDRQYDKGGVKKNNDESEDESASPNSGNAKSRRGQRGKSLACPHNKQNPLKFCASGNAKYQTCTNPFPKTADLIQHFKRTHKYDDLICVRCTEKFESQWHLTCHLRKERLCNVVTWQEIEEEKWLIRGSRPWQDLKDVGKKSRHERPETQWNRIFRAIFPEVAVPPSPYHDASSGSGVANVQQSGEPQANHNQSAQLTEPYIGQMGTWNTNFDHQGALESIGMTSMPPSRAYYMDLTRQMRSGDPVSFEGSPLSFRLDQTQGLSSSFPPNHPTSVSNSIVPSQTGFPINRSAEAFRPNTHGQYLELPQQRRQSHRQGQSSRNRHHQRQHPQNFQQQQQHHSTSTIPAPRPWISHGSWRPMPGLQDSPMGTGLGLGSGGGIQHFFNSDNTVQSHVNPEEFEANDFRFPSEDIEYDEAGNFNPDPSPDPDSISWPPDPPNHHLPQFFEERQQHNQHQNQHQHQYQNGSYRQ